MHSEQGKWESHCFDDCVSNFKLLIDDLCYWSIAALNKSRLVLLRQPCELLFRIHPAEKVKTLTGAISPLSNFHQALRTEVRDKILKTRPVVESVSFVLCGSSCLWKNIPEAEKSNLRIADIDNLNSAEPNWCSQADTWTQTLHSCAFRAIALSHIYESVIEPTVHVHYRRLKMPLAGEDLVRCEPC